MILFIGQTLANSPGFTLSNERPSLALISRLQPSRMLFSQYSMRMLYLLIDLIMINVSWGGKGSNRLRHQRSLCAVRYILQILGLLYDLYD